MSWCLEEAISYYQTQGAPNDQSALISLLREIQAECGGIIPVSILEEAAKSYGIKESLLYTLIKQIPSLRLADQHCLEVCTGPNCSKASALAACAETICSDRGGNITLKYVPCMRMCGKGPNIKWDGVLYSKANEVLLLKLIKR